MEPLGFRGGTDRIPDVERLGLGCGADRIPDVERLGFLCGSSDAVVEGPTEVESHDSRVG